MLQPGIAAAEQCQLASLRQQDGGGRPLDGRIEVVRLGRRRAEIPSLVFVRADGGC